MTAPMTNEPAHGWADGQPVHRHTKDHLPGRFNRWLAIKVTNGVGTMWCAYAFTLLALISLPSVLKSGGVVGIVSWIAQTFLQLVLLSIIIVGQNVQAEASDARAAKTFADTELLVDRLDTTTRGGLTDVLKAVNALKGEVIAALAARNNITTGRTPPTPKPPSSTTPKGTPR